MSTNYSPSRSIGSARLQIGLGGVSRLRSSALKKPPEPLRRAVADCLSSSSASSSGVSSGSFAAHRSSSPAVSDASRTLRDYLATSSTTDMAYSVILEHTISERERSPAVVSRCVALLKRHLLRYKPSEETLHQIDKFCVSTIAEYDITSSRRSSPWSQSLNQQTLTSAASTNISPLPVSSFESEALVKSLNYVRSLVAQHIPKRSFQGAAFSGGFTASRQSLPTLSSLLSKSFNTQLTPSNNGESSEVKDTSSLSVSNLTSIGNNDKVADSEYIAQDVLKWRWSGELDSPLISAESDRASKPQNIRTHSFLEVGAAALLVGDMDTKLKNRQPSNRLRTADIPCSDQLVRSSSVTTATNSVRPHLRAITASKRTKLGPHQIWEDSPVSTFRPRARQLFQYRHYSEQQPLRLNTLEVGDVIAAVCLEQSSPIVNVMTVSSRLSSNNGKPSIDVAVSVLIKLVIDMYVMDSRIAAPLTLSMLEEMLNSPRSASRARAFDLILNLGVHAHLLEPMVLDEATTIEEDYGQDYINDEGQLGAQGMRKTESSKNSGSSAIDKFESWILSILNEILLLLVQIEEKEESVWASGFSCLLYFICDRGKIWRRRLKGLDIRVIKSLLEISRKNSWAEIVHSKLICIFTNMFYQDPVGTEPASSTTRFLPGQVDLIGGIEFIFCEYSLATTRSERRNLYLVLFEYVLHQTNEMNRAGGLSEYGDDEIGILANLLTVADAPEAFYISIKLGVEGITEILRNSIVAALSRYPNSERLNMLLDDITGKFDAIISSFTKLDKEFTHLMQLTKSHKLLRSIEDNFQGKSDGSKLKFSWGTLHSLLHSERFAYRQNGYVWLGDLLIAEISEGTDIWSNIRNLQQRIALADHDALEASDVPLPILLLCGLLKSKNNFIRWGFLFVVERLLMRCKCLLDENKQHSSSGEGGGHAEGARRLEKANAVIDIMTSALSLVAQLNETDRINILKMCEILFSQLFLKAPLATSMAFEDALHNGTLFSGMDYSKKDDSIELSLQRESCQLEGIVENIDSSCGFNNCETSSMAALLLRGHAIVPIQLIARVPAVLFYWPLIQLAGAATDNIALGVAVGSKGKGNLPGATSDIRATLLLLLIGKCTADAAAFQEVGGQEFFRELLDDTDSRVAYYSSAFLLKRMMIEEPENYQRLLQNLVLRAQQELNVLENVWSFLMDYCGIAHPNIGYLRSGCSTLLQLMKAIRSEKTGQF